MLPDWKYQCPEFKGIETSATRCVSSLAMRKYQCPEFKGIETSEDFFDRFADFGNTNALNSKGLRRLYSAEPASKLTEIPMNSKGLRLSKYRLYLMRHENALALNTKGLRPKVTKLMLRH